MSLVDQETQLPESNRVYLDVIDTGVDVALFTADEAFRLFVDRSARVYNGSLLSSTRSTISACVTALVYRLTRQHAHTEVLRLWPQELKLVSSPFVEHHADMKCSVWYGADLPLMATIPLITIPTTQLPVEVPSSGFENVPAVKARRLTQTSVEADKQKAMQILGVSRLGRPGRYVDVMFSELGWCTVDGFQCPVGMMYEFVMNYGTLSRNVGCTEYTLMSRCGRMHLVEGDEFLSTIWIWNSKEEFEAMFVSQ